MLQERRAIPTEYSIQIAHDNIEDQLLVEGYDKGKILVILRQAIQDYKEDPRNLDAISHIYAIVYGDSSYYYVRNILKDEVNKILRTNFSPDILTEPLIVWKKASRSDFHESVGYEDTAALVKLELPAGARMVRSLFSNKCRTDKAKVLAITSLDGSINYQIARSCLVWDFYYNVGQVVEPHTGKFDDRPWMSCSSGIHFFESKEEAIEYDFR